MKKTIALLLCSALLSHHAVAHDTPSANTSDTVVFNTLCNSDVSSLLTPDTLDYYLWACQAEVERSAS